MRLVTAFSLPDILNYGLLYLYNMHGIAQFIICTVLICIAGYLLGSIDSAIIISKLKYGKDIRELGSGNAGMTNMLRTFGKKAAALTILGDLAKTALACLIGALVLGKTGAYFAGYAAVLGHIWPVWFKFKGGKGVLALATVILCCEPRMFLIGITIFFLTVAFSKYISLGSVVSALLLPVILSRLIGSSNLVVIPTFAICLLIIWKHRSNIKRLMSGQENKIHLGKDGNYLPNRLLIVIGAVLTALSILVVVSLFRTQYAITYSNGKISSSAMRILFIDEKNEYFGENEHNDEHDDEIMEKAIDRAKRILVLNSAAASAGRAVSSEGQDAANSYFKDLTAMYGYREDDTAQTYCHRIYGSDVSPADVIRIVRLRIYADEYAAVISEEDANALIEDADSRISVKNTVINSIKNRF